MKMKLKMKNHIRPFEQSVRNEEVLDQVVIEDDILIYDDEVDEFRALPSQIDRCSNLEMVTPRHSERECKLPDTLKKMLTGMFTAAAVLFYSYCPKCVMYRLMFP